MVGQNLLNFVSHSERRSNLNLFVSICEMQTGKLDEEQKAELQQAFDLFDKDKSGSITINELSDVMNSLGFNPTKQQLTDMVTK